MNTWYSREKLGQGGARVQYPYVLSWKASAPRPMHSFRSIVRTNVLPYILQISSAAIPGCAARVVFTIGGLFLPRLLSVVVVGAFCVVAALVATAMASVSSIWANKRRLLRSWIS